MTTETELKLRLPSTKNTAFKRLLAAHQPQAAPPTTEHLFSLYFDTPSLELAQRDMGLRLRQVDGQWLQTLKLGEQAGAGLHQRPELEVPVTGQALELDQIANNEVRQFLSQKRIASALSPLFTTDITRTQWILQDLQGNTMEVSLDHGSIIARQRTLKINEVEIELKQGNVQGLFELALSWAGSLPLIPEAPSKAARGYALYQERALLAPSKAQIPCLRSKMTPHAAMQAVMLETLRHLQANVPGVLESEEMEFVHQARVALRRLRSAQKAFGDIAPDEAWQAITPEIQWLATLLGNMRDLDVFLAETLPPIEAALAPDADFTSLKTVMLERRDQCRREIHSALTSARYGALLLRLLAWLNQEAPVPASKSDKLRRFAHQSLDKRWRQVERLAQDWQSLDREQRHDVRKRAKKLRYAAEFFSSLYKPKPVKRYLDRLQGLQQILGAMNDGVAAQVLMAQFIQQDASLGHVAGLVVGWLACEAKRSEADLEQAIADLVKTKDFW
jgi:inorganic triphosphatase YgiF